MMLSPLTTTPLEQQIDSALASNLLALKEGFFDLLAALVLCIIAILSLLHAVMRLVFAWLGLMLWVVALLITGLYWLRSWCVARSTSSLHRDFCHDKNEEE